MRIHNPQVDQIQKKAGEPIASIASRNPHDIATLSTRPITSSPGWGRASNPVQRRCCRWELGRWGLGGRGRTRWRLTRRRRRRMPAARRLGLAARGHRDDPADFVGDLPWNALRHHPRAGDRHDLRDAACDAPLNRVRNLFRDAVGDLARPDFLHRPVRRHGNLPRVLLANHVADLVRNPLGLLLADLVAATDRVFLDDFLAHGPADLDRHLFDDRSRHATAHLHRHRLPHDFTMVRRARNLLGNDVRVPNAAAGIVTGALNLARLGSSRTHRVRTASRRARDDGSVCVSQWPQSFCTVYGGRDRLLDRVALLGVDRFHDAVIDRAAALLVDRLDDLMRDDARALALFGRPDRLLHRVAAFAIRGLVHGPLDSVGFRASSSSRRPVCKPCNAARGIASRTPCDSRSPDGGRRQSRTPSG